MFDFDAFTHRLDAFAPVQKVGRVAQATGLIIETDGPNLGLGDVCEIRPRIGGRYAGENEPAALRAEVVGFREHRLLLMPLGEIGALEPGAEVIACPAASTLEVGPGVIGRVLDGLGNPIDELGPLRGPASPRPLKNAPPNPLRRQRIREPFETGVRAIDLFTPVGRGQRMGIFAGSGVGKSSLMGVIARGSEADVNVIALIGERGRELREFIENDLGKAGMARSVIVVATSDQPAPVRLRAAWAATAIAEWFRDQGRNVLFMMDSVTRLAMAQREVGLAVGEPPASRGYPPSVFALLPRLLERTGTAERGAITAFYTVLVEGDDFNEPVADTVRGILDGHIILSRALAAANHFPAIDVLESISRLTRDVSTPAQLDRVATARDLLATYRRHEDLISVGAYSRGSNPKLDIAVDRHEAIDTLLRQGLHERSTRTSAHEQLARILPAPR